jgi:hypothetical protein
LPLQQSGQDADDDSSDTAVVVAVPLAQGPYRQVSTPMTVATTRKNPYVSRVEQLQLQQQQQHADDDDFGDSFDDFLLLLLLHLFPLDFPPL